ncbi:dihydrolipoamide acetyltransferase family protein [Ureibacillus composti]|nr:dihydrolipoamide acetyltransferase family protein [Ureibacillus composti]
MPIENILMPQLGESVTEGTIERWLVAPGDQINKYDPLAEVITDKVNAEIPSSFSGTIKELIAKEGETLPVGAIVCTIEVEGDVVKSSEPKSPPDLSVTLSSTDAQPDGKQDVTAPMQKKQVVSGSKSRYSPAVLNLANTHNINLELVEGTGFEGRITRKDLMKLIESGNIPSTEMLQDKSVQETITQIQSLQEVAIPEKKVSTAAITAGNGDIEIPITAVRRAIANKMIQSKHEIPHAWMMMEVDVTNLVAYRNSIKNDFKHKEGFNITYFAFFVKAVAQALKEFPLINSVWAGDKIIQKKDINLSIAVATEEALYVPVIKNVDEKSIKGIAKDIQELSGLVRKGKLTTDHMQGGTFTVNNTGSFGSVQSMGVINYPQAAILQVEAIVKRPVIVNGGMFAARDMVNLCLSLDHRILDGLICGNFLNRVKDILENTNYEQMSVY